MRSMWLLVGPAQSHLCTTYMPPLPDGQAGDRRGHVDSCAAHIPTPRTPLAHRGLAFGLTRFACPTFLKIFPFGVEQGVAAERGQRKRCPPPLRPPTPCLIDPMGGPVCRRAHRGRSPRGLGAACPLPRSALGAGGTPGGAAGRRPPLPLLDPPCGGSRIWYSPRQRRASSVRNSSE